MTAPLIIHDERDRPDQQEVVVMLADFSFTPAEQIFENLKKSGSMAGMAKPASAMASMPSMKMRRQAAVRARPQRRQIRRLPRQ